jgi:hypothetical protein
LAQAAVEGRQECRLMDMQLPLPGYWPRNATWSDPKDDLAQLERDKLEAKHEIRQVLDKYAERHGVDPSEVNRLVWGYVDDLLGDFFYERESEIRDGIVVAEGTDVEGGFS